MKKPKNDNRDKTKTIQDTSLRELEKMKKLKFANKLPFSLTFLCVALHYSTSDDTLATCLLKLNRLNAIKICSSLSRTPC